MHDETMLDVLKDIRDELQTIRQCGINQDNVTYYLQPIYERLRLYEMSMEVSELRKRVKGIEGTVDAIAENEGIEI